MCFFLFWMSIFCDALYAGKGEIRKLEGKMLISLEVNDEKEKEHGEK